MIRNKKVGLLISIIFLFLLEAIVPPFFAGFDILLSKWMIFQLFLFFILVILSVGYWIRTDNREKRITDTPERTNRNAESELAASDLEFINPSNLIGAVAHEIRNPLNRLQLKLQKSPDEVDWNGLNETYDEILEIFNRVESVFREQNPNEHWIPVPKFCGLVKRSVESPELINWKSGMDWIYLDPYRMQLALKNLIKNSTEAYENVDGNIDVSFFSYGPEWCIQVTDYAGGIDPDLARTISTRNAKSDTKGMGLGLMIAQQIVKNHSGRMVIESEQSVGTEITLTFPLQNGTE